MAIDQHNNESQTKWDRGGYGVMIKSPMMDQPIGFCDGTEADREAIIAMAAEEGAQVEIEVKLLKTGREVWTVRPVAEL